MSPRVTCVQTTLVLQDGSSPLLRGRHPSRWARVWRAQEAGTDICLHVKVNEEQGPLLGGLPTGSFTRFFALRMQKYL